MRALAVGLCIVALGVMLAAVLQPQVDVPALGFGLVAFVVAAGIVAGDVLSDHPDEER